MKEWSFFLVGIVCLESNLSINTHDCNLKRGIFTKKTLIQSLFVILLRTYKLY